jgi:PhnB protein
MTVTFNPYLNFKDNAREAIEFYKTVFGGDLNIMTFEQGQMSQSDADKDLVMHAELRNDSGFVLMASDTAEHVEYRPGTNVSMSLSGDDDQTLRGYFDKLAAGGTVAQPLTQAPWGDTFGMCTDRFGIQWLVNISAAPSA